MNSATTSQRMSLRNIHLFARQQTARWPVIGQGTVSVGTQTAAPVPFQIVLTPEPADGQAIGLSISENQIELWVRDGAERRIVSQASGENLGLNPSGEALPYWLSLDSNNQRIRYGKGEMLHALMLFEFSWAAEGRESSLQKLSKTLCQIEVQNTEVIELKLLEVPVNLDPAPQIVSTDTLTLEMLANNSATVAADLPNACQRLYANVSGVGVNLHPADFPEFAQAIQYSIVTPGALCNKKLQEKDPIFGYLRVTIDTNQGDSPGQPYVLEIWPAGSRSPIHDHGEACAVIKVLSGQIQVSWFAALSPDISQPWGSAIMHAGGITFLTPDYYQIHQLHNPSPKTGGEFCATIQCYRYPDYDTIHYEYFDYIEDGTVKQFLPDSDWSYLDFKALIQAEWTEAMKAAG